MKTRNFGLITLVAISSLALTGCNNSTNTPTDDNVEIANPASVYCQENGGTLNLEESLCTFSDGSYCEQWAYYNGECQPWTTIDIENLQVTPEPIGFEVDYWTSEIYSQEDMDSAIAAIMNVFNNEREVKCEMHKVYYAWDEKSQQELPNLQLRSDVPYTQALVMLSNFHTPANPEEAMAFEPDYEYTDWNWILWKTDDGEWTVLDWWY